MGKGGAQEEEDDNAGITKEQLQEQPGYSAGFAWPLISLCMACALVVFCFMLSNISKSEYYRGHRWIDRTDQFQPQSVALANRFFSEYAYHERSIEPGTNLDPHMPFMDLTCLCQSASYRMRSGDIAAWCNYAAIQAANESQEAKGRGEPFRRAFRGCQYKMPFSPVLATLCASFIGFAFVTLYAWSVLKMPRGTQEMDKLGTTIAEASMIFLKQEYLWLAPFCLCLLIFIYTAVDGQHSPATPLRDQWRPDFAVSFIFGSSLSAACGLMGMKIATEGNVRTTTACALGGISEGIPGGGLPSAGGLAHGLEVAFRSGACMGCGIVSFGMFGLSTTYMMFGNTAALGGFSFGASAVALFARVGGGIYTKAADVGGDLCGKVEAALDEDSPKNPATIADCVGDNVGDTAGMGADLFESYVGSVVAACVLGAAEFGELGVGYPFWLMVIGQLASLLCTYTIHVPKARTMQSCDCIDDAPACCKQLLCGSDDRVGFFAHFFGECGDFVLRFLGCEGALDVCCGKSRDDKEQGLHELLIGLSFNVAVAGFLIVIGTVAMSLMYFKDVDAYLDLVDAKWQMCYPGARLLGCVCLGLVAGIFIGKVTEYFTSHTDAPTRSIAKAGEYGPGPVIIQGIGMGMYSTAVPMCLIVATVLGSYYMAGLYGTSIACVGMLSTLGVTMSTDAYGPVSDNAGGIAEMCDLPPWVRVCTDELDALGNTTAATGKGFSNGSAVLAAISLLAAFSRMAGIEYLNLLNPVVVIGILLGALQPYIFAALTMLSVNKAAQQMMAEVRRQFRELEDDQGRNILDPEYDGPPPEYALCIAISTNSALKEMMMPGLLAVFCPLVIGFTFGSHCLGGFLIGAIASGYLLGVQMSNTGGAWDNAKKYVEKGELKLRGLVRKKKTMEHAAVVAGDTVGDPLKDTSGPSLNILIKLMTGFSFVIAELLDPGWKHFWVGILLASAAIILAVLIQFLLLRDPTPPDEYYHEYHGEGSGTGVMEQFDFIDSSMRRMDNEIAKLHKDRQDLDLEFTDIQEKHPEVHRNWRDSQHAPDE